MVCTNESDNCSKFFDAAFFGGAGLIRINFQPQTRPIHAMWDIEMVAQLNRQQCEAQDPGADALRSLPHRPAAKLKIFQILLIQDWV